MVVVAVVVLQRIGQFGEVELGVGAVELTSSGIVSHGGFVGGVEGAEPEPGAAIGFADFGDPLAPGPLPNALVSARGVLWAPFATHTTFPGAGLRGLLHLLLSLARCSSTHH